MQRLRRFLHAVLFALACAPLLSPPVRAQDPVPQCSPQVVAIVCNPLPDFRGCTRPQAERWAGECGYTTSFPTEEEYSPLPEGMISGQTIRAGTPAGNERFLGLFLSIGPRPPPPITTPEPTASPIEELPTEGLGPDATPSEALGPDPIPSGTGTTDGPAEATYPANDGFDVPSPPWWNDLPWALIGVAVLVLAGAGYGIRKLFFSPVVPEVDCFLGAGAPGACTREGAAFTPPPVEITVRIARGRLAANPGDIEVREDEGD